MYSIISDITIFVANRILATYILLNAISIKYTIVSLLLCRIRGSVRLLTCALYAVVWITIR